MKKRYVVLIVLAVLAAGVVAFGYWWTGGSARHVAASPAKYPIDARLNLPYVDEFADPRQRLDLFLPVGTKNPPLAAIWHGGGWSQGERSNEGVQRLAQWLAERGVAAAAMGYRLAGPIDVREQARDAARGVAWLHAHAAEFGFDPRRIVLVGHSAGAQLASLIACDRQYLNALGVPASVPAGVVAVACPCDVRGDRIGAHPLARRMVDSTFGDDAALRAACSPIAFVRAGLPPFLLIVGRGDRLLPKTQATDMLAAIRAAGGQGELLEVPGRAHIDLFHLMTEPGDLAGEATLRFAAGR